MAARCRMLRGQVCRSPPCKRDRKSRLQTKKKREDSRLFLPAFPSVPVRGRAPGLSCANAVLTACAADLALTRPLPTSNELPASSSRCSNEMNSRLDSLPILPHQSPLILLILLPLQAPFRSGRVALLVRRIVAAARTPPVSYRLAVLDL